MVFQVGPGLWSNWLDKTWALKGLKTSLGIEVISIYELSFKNIYKTRNGL